MSTFKSNFFESKPNLGDNFLNFDLKFNEKIYSFSFYDIGNDSLQIIATENINNNDIAPLNKYSIILQFRELKILHIYFNMFTTFEQVKNIIIGLYNKNSIKIIEIKENELSINFDLQIPGNESMIINLTKMKNDINEDMSYIFKCYNQQKTEINELKNTIKDMSNTISNLIKRIEVLENKSEKSFKSNIIKNNQELMLLYSNISPLSTNISLQLLYSSEKDGENPEKFKNAYLNKNDIIILIQTQKDKRFGGYAHEKFQDTEKYEMKDTKAFLFNLDKMKIYQSKGGANAIWNYDGKSMDFGSGTDLRIFHNFLNEKNYTCPSKNDYNYDENYALNGERFFEIKFLELFKVNIN